MTDELCEAVAGDRLAVEQTLDENDGLRESGDARRARVVAQARLIVFDLGVSGAQAELDPAELTKVIVPRPLPPVVASTYSARVAGDDGITMLDAIECWIYQHGLRHMGEIELARGLVGLGGMTS